MGHSFGGAFMQVLLDRGLGAAGVGIDAGTVRGVLDLPFSTVRSAWSLLRNPLLRHRAVPLSAKGFNYAFTNHITLEESEPIYRRYCVPGSRNVLFTGANANLNPATVMKVNFGNNDRAPLLFIAGGNDHVVPGSVNRHNAAKYRKSSAVTDWSPGARTSPWGRMAGRKSPTTRSTGPRQDSVWSTRGSVRELRHSVVG